MSQVVRQVIVLSTLIVAITLGAMLLLLSAFGSAPTNAPRLAAPTLAAPDPTPELIAQAEREAPIPSGAMALLLGAISGLLVILLSLTLLRAQRASQGR
ncbi:MAG: hypothetical protein CUN49_07950 [Candidatus Thermofonsia Clade 1 bacterium]|jgi:hypothetical protein|uniref:Uncharacterized protein n=1 Tax=Candidatus Thermofonsia Clade 1 bacterium TaxID=2364210 RepID=A0A2M8PEI2_9CHLR|nr:MAG: hypothetical protein CUN49_07950 [Candidatus Thermofonsia Clade 1 bacterium]RMF51398.1 MAG: hypothetical protein D6749_07925 [Chloroflexota bacterium]